MNLYCNVTAISRGISTYFQAVGGVAPYSYNVLVGGAGGSIDADTGLYTAPENYGIDTVQATDDNGAFVQLQIRVLHPIQIVCDILEHEMGLARTQIWMWNQKLNLPKDQNLVIVVGELSCKVISNVAKPYSIDSGMEQRQYTNFQSTLSVDVYCRTSDAIYRKEEIIMALHSQYSEQQAELNHFRLGYLPTGFVNISELDGNYMPYRYNITFTISYAIQKSSSVEYFTDFSGVEIDTNTDDQYIISENDIAIATENDDFIDFDT